MPVRRLIAVLTMLGLAADGCATGDAPPPAKATPGTLVVSIAAGAGDTVTADGWKVAETDLPAYVAHRRAAAVVIRGSPGSSYDRALRIESALEQVGVHDVTIAPITP